jgi:putative tryptophan/tyrosine transport system substrate-binding protein
MPVVGFLNSGSHEERAHLVSAFKQGLSETGHIEGRNVAIEYRWAEGQYDRLPAQAAEFVRRPVAVIAAPFPSRNGAPKAQICDADHRRARRGLLYG